MEEAAVVAEAEEVADHPDRMRESIWTLKRDLEEEVVTEVATEVKIPEEKIISKRISDQEEEVVVEAVADVVATEVTKIETMDMNPDKEDLTTTDPQEITIDLMKTELLETTTKNTNNLPEEEEVASEEEIEVATEVAIEVATEVAKEVATEAVTEDQEVAIELAKPNHTD